MPNFLAVCSLCHSAYHFHREFMYLGSPQAEITMGMILKVRSQLPGYDLERLLALAGFSAPPDHWQHADLPECYQKERRKWLKLPP